MYRGDILKKKLITLFILVLVGSLFACSSLNDDRPNDNGNEATSIEPIEERDDNRNEQTSIGPIEESTFTGIIEEINGDNAIVSIEKGDILNSGSKASVNLSVASDTTFEVGDKVKVGFNGDVREIFPLGINTTFVELVK